jgi:hypothetical protein
VGTSNAYGGSGSQSWRQARDAWLELISGDSASAPSVAGAAAANATARSLRGGSRGLAEGATTGSSGRAARLVSGARSGGRAIAAAWAYERGDRDTLSGLGLDLAELQAMSLKARCQTILDATMVAVDQPDDVAMRKAALTVLKELLGGEGLPLAIDAVRAFIVEYIFEIALVEVATVRELSGLSAAQLAVLEKRARDYLRRRVSNLELAFDGTSVAPASLAAAIERLLPVVTATLGKVE